MDGFNEDSLVHVENAKSIWVSFSLGLGFSHKAVQLLTYYHCVLVCVHILSLTLDAVIFKVR